MSASPRGTFSRRSESNRLTRSGRRASAKHGRRTVERSVRGNRRKSGTASPTERTMCSSVYPANTSSATLTRQHDFDPLSTRESGDEYNGTIAGSASGSSLWRTNAGSREVLVALDLALRGDSFTVLPRPLSRMEFVVTRRPTRNDDGERVESGHCVPRLPRRRRRSNRGLRTEKDADRHISDEPQPYRILREPRP